jgi:ssDNA-binding replication factor A large subunit
MKISELEPNNPIPSLEAQVIEVSQARKTKKGDRELRAADAMLSDETGTAWMVLWNEEIDCVQQGNVIRLSNAFYGQFKGRPTITLGKQGKLKVIA